MRQSGSGISALTAFGGSVLLGVLISLFPPFRLSIELVFGTIWGGLLMLIIIKLLERRARLRVSPQLQRKRQSPAYLFPVRNDATGNVVWFEVVPSGYGLYVTVHKSEPPIEQAMEWSPHTAMAMVHVDYFVASENQEQEQVKVQLWDERTDPYGDPGWDIPPDYNHLRDASIILVEDVQQWQPPKEGEQGK